MHHSSYAVFAVVLLGCSSSSSPSTEPTDTGTPADTAVTDSAVTDTEKDTAPDTATTDSPADTKPGTCAFVGSWTLEKFECDTTDITASWKGIIGSTTYVFTAGPLGCHVVLSNKNPSCTEVQEFDWTIATDGAVTAAVSIGITSCTPASCTFTTGDAPCVIGDRASSGDAGTGESASVVRSGTKLVLSVKKSGDICSGKDQHQTLAPT